MRQHSRFLFQPVLPLGKNRTFVTGCKAHWDIARQAAAEGTVLLKNDGTLPLAVGTRICLFGRGAGNFLYGGGGSGRVYTDREISLADGLENAQRQGLVSVFPDTVSFYREQAAEEFRRINAQYGSVAYFRHRRGHDRPEPHLPENIYEKAKAFGGTAIFCLTRHSSEGTDYGDREAGPGGFGLYEEERRLLEKLCRDFVKVVVVLNLCGPVETGWFKHNEKIGALVYATYGGGIAGEVLTDILLGKRYPSGHLQDTLAYSIEDYPSTASYNESRDYVNYTEDIFVGYRYFETFAPEKVVYPYGFGLGYTTFCLTKEAASLEKNTVRITVDVENTGSFPGKEVVQVYLSAPQGILGKAKKVLCAFEKTKELKPGEHCKVQLHFDIREFGSYDDLGKIQAQCFLLEKGQYCVHVGCNVRDTQEYLTFTLGENILCRKCNDYLAPIALDQRLTGDGTYEALPKGTLKDHNPKGYRLRQEAAPKDFALIDALKNDTLDSFMARMTDPELCELLYGHPDTNAADTNGIGLMRRERQDQRMIPLVPTADGPAGFRAIEHSGILSTFFPCANTVSQTWNLSIAQKIGAAGAREVKENNAGIWLAPGMNIHRSPLCGRNFEYYSEDPLAAGMFAAANVKGVQSQNIAATVKHFCCNNKEVNRKGSDSRVSQRALREIYLRPFEIAVKKAQPWALMTSYNQINGVKASANWESITGILRGEWGYKGLVMTDWWAFTHIEDEIHAGSDVKMPMQITYQWEKARSPYSLTESLQNGTLDRSAVLASARRVLELMKHFD